MNGDLVGLLLLIPFFLIGFALLGAAFRSAWRATRARRWPTTPGIITSVAIKENAGNDDGIAYKVKVEYAYAVDGIDYTGSRLAFGYCGGPRQDQEEILGKLQRATTVDVRYDPAQPAASTLSCGVHRDIKATVAFAVASLAIPVAFLFFSWLQAGGDVVLLHGLSVK